MRIPTRTILLSCLWACRVPSTPGPAARLTAGGSDTIVVNTRHPTRLPIRALDAAGRTIVGAPIGYEWEGGAPLHRAGAVACDRSGDFAVRAVLAQLAIRVVVRCWPVKYLQIPGPVQFILGDSQLSQPRAISLDAYGPDGRRVRLFTAQGAFVLDSMVATLHGLVMSPRSRGITMVSAVVGDATADMGVHVYQRVETLAALDTVLHVHPKQRLFAVPLRLARGAVQRHGLPPGSWMLGTLPEEDQAPSGIGVRVEGAACTPNLLNIPGRLGCHIVGSGTTVVVHRSARGREPRDATGYLLVRWLF